MLLPAAPKDWLTAGHLAHFINETDDALELKAFYGRCKGGGSRNQPFQPAMMVKVLIYAHASGVFSSRKIEPAARGPGVSDAGCGQLPSPPNDLRLPRRST